MRASVKRKCLQTIAKHYENRLKGSVPVEDRDRLQMTVDASLVGSPHKLIVPVNQYTCTHLQQVASDACTSIAVIACYGMLFSRNGIHNLTWEMIVKRGVQLWLRGRERRAARSLMESQQTPSNYDTAREVWSSERALKTRMNCVHEAGGRMPEDVEYELEKVVQDYTDVAFVFTTSLRSFACCAQTPNTLWLYDSHGTGAPSGHGQSAVLQFAVRRDAWRYISHTYASQNVDVARSELERQNALCFSVCAFTRQQQQVPSEHNGSVMNKGKDLF